MEKAFLMISIRGDRDVLRFLWIEDINSDSPSIETYRFTRVVFGVSSGPFLINATIKHHLELYSPSYPELAQTLLQSFYVDHVMTGVDSEEEGFRCQGTDEEGRL